MGNTSTLPFALEEAILDPAGTFACPQDVLQAAALSDALKAKILQIWRLDAHRQLTDATREVPEVEEYEILQEINHALGQLRQSTD